MKPSMHRGSYVTRYVAAVLLLIVATTPAVFGSAAAQEAEPSLAIISPAAGETVTTDDVEVEVAVEGFALDCSQAGLPDEEGVGHLHVMVDGMSMAELINFFCDETFTVPGEGLDPGTHTLIVTLATNTHMDLMETAQQVEFDYQPENPRPLPEADFTGEPGVELISPTDGDTVPPVFTVEVEPVNFTSSAGLEGKPNVPGFGHWHVWVDTDMSAMMDMDMDMDMAGTPDADGDMDGMEMMSMAGMVAMPGENTFELDLSAWGPGEHTIWIEPVQNDHTMFESFGHVEFTVIVDPDASAS